MNRGRRPRPGGRQLQVNPQTAAVQERIDDIALVMLDELRTQIRDRIARKQMGKMTLTTLTKELSRLLNAIKKPNANLQMMMAPQVKQLADTQSRRDRVVEVGATVNEAQLIASQDCCLDNHPEIPR